MLFGLGNTLRSLTRSPVTSVADQLHRAAPSRLNAGGAATATSGKARPMPQPPEEFVLPKDIDADDVVAAIEAKLLGQGSPPDRDNTARPLIELRAGGRIVVPGYHLLRLGDGRFDLGKRFMHGLVWRIRRDRARRRTGSRLSKSI